MEESAKHRHMSDPSSHGTREQSAVESAASAVARLLANPRRTRRD